VLSRRTRRAITELSHRSEERQLEAYNRLARHRRFDVFFEILEHAEDVRSGGPLWHACFAVGGFYQELDRRQKAEAVRLLKRFLLAAQHNYADCSWLAGDALGARIHTRAAEKALVAAALDARCRFGRGSALHGLVHYSLERPRRKEAVLDVLRRVARSDRAASIRAFAQKCTKAVTKDTDVHAYPFEGGQQGPVPLWCRDKAAAEELLKTVRRVRQLVRRMRRMIDTPET